MSTIPSSIATTSSSNYLTDLGLGYSIAIALGFLVFVSTVILAYYVCLRAARNRSASHSSRVSSNLDEGVMVPRMIFVGEDDDDEEDHAIPAQVGLEQVVINSYPKIQFSRNSCADGSSMCSICLCDFKEGETMRMMPECNHYFHVLCIDAWLKLNGSCPVCRNSPLPTPLSTPLAEVVPLSQYAADRHRRR